MKKPAAPVVLMAAAPSITRKGKGYSLGVRPIVAPPPTAKSAILLVGL